MIGDGILDLSNHVTVALQAASRREQTPAFAKLYARREGIEVTISQGVRAFDMRLSRSIDFDKTHLQHVTYSGRG